MCHQACLPDSWWEFCVLHANYLYNCTPMRCLDWKTSKGYFEKVDPDISHLHVLGCRAYIFIHKDLRVNKSSPKLELMTFLGFHDDCESNLMFICPPNNVIFMEVLAVPPLFLQESGHSGEILVDSDGMKFSSRPC